MTDRRKAIRERVLALLDAADAGGSENWRDGDPAYWVGVAEGAYDAEGKADALRSEVSRLTGEVARFKEREEHFAKALGVADGGQYRADWDGAIERVLRERDDARSVLREVEWADNSGDEYAATCPWCGGTSPACARDRDWPATDPDIGHRPDCRRQAALPSPPPGGPEHEHSEDCRGVDHARLPGAKGA